MRTFGLALAIGSIVGLAACGGGSSSSNNNNYNSGSTGSTTNNVQPIAVNAGPPGVNAANSAFTSVTVCAPGSTTQCQTVDNVLVDTGSSGLRLLSSVLTISLPVQNSPNGNTLAECNIFEDGYTWGPVAKADIKMAGEIASSSPVQVIIPSTSSPAVPSSCSSQTTGPDEGDSVVALQSNGVLGVGLFSQDCGQACTPGFTLQNVYYDCPSSGCNPVAIALAQQVSNPVSFFASDNNGVVLELPSVPVDGSPAVSGSLIFGIGTQSDNALGSATIYSANTTGNSKIIALSHVGNVGDDIAVVILFQPRNDDGGVEPSGICQYDFLTHRNSLAESDERRLPAIKP